MRWGAAGPGGTGWRQVGKPRSHPFLEPSRESGTTVLKVPLQVRTWQIWVGRMVEKNPRLSTSSSTIYPHFINRIGIAYNSWLLTAVPLPTCPCQPLSCDACSEICFENMCLKPNLDISFSTDTFVLAWNCFLCFSRFLAHFNIWLISVSGQIDYTKLQPFLMCIWSPNLILNTA